MGGEGNVSVIWGGGKRFEKRSEHVTSRTLVPTSISWPSFWAVINLIYWVSTNPRTYSYLSMTLERENQR